MFSKGADVDALRDSAARLASFGNEIDVVRARSRRAVSTLQRVWQGPDLQHVVERWRRVEHDLVRTSLELDRLSRRLHDNADLQHRSSGSPSGWGAGAPSVGHASPTSGGHGGSGAHATWAGPAGAPSVDSLVPQAHTAMVWAHWIGGGQVLGVHPIPSAVAASAAAHQLGLRIR